MAAALTMDVLAFRAGQQQVFGRPGQSATKDYVFKFMFNSYRHDYV